MKGEDYLTIIQELFRVIKIQGREPTLILVHPKILEKMIKSSPISKYFAPTNTLKLFDIDIITTSKVKDIYVVDNRDWAELLIQLLKPLRI